MMQGMMVSSGMECEMEDEEGEESEAGGMGDVIKTAESEMKSKIAEGGEDDEDISEYIKAEMKKGSKLPMNGKSMTVVARAGGKGGMMPKATSKMKRYG